MKEPGKKPLVSVFMPTYNHEHYISESIESVLSQDYDNMEIIIVDDASTDRTPEIIKEYDRKYPGLFKIKINEKNLGVTQTCNIILSMCTGKYVAFTSGDDIWLCGKLNKQISWMEAHPDCVLSYHDVELFNSGDNRTLGYRNSGVSGKKAYDGDSKEVVNYLIIQANAFIAATSVVVRSDMIPKWGFDSRVPIVSDWLLWIDILANGDGTVRFIAEVLARYRRHENNVSNRDNIDDALVSLAIIEHRYLWLSRPVMIARGYFYYLRGVNYIQKGERRIGRHLLYMGLRQSIYSWKWVIWWLVSFVPSSYITSNSKKTRLEKLI